MTSMTLLNGEAEAREKKTAAVPFSRACSFELPSLSLHARSTTFQARDAHRSALSRSSS